MRALRIVDRHPLSRDPPNLVQAAKEIAIEDLIAIGAIEPFDTRILRGASWLDMINQHSIRLSPIEEALSEKLWAVIHSDHVG